MAKITVEYLKYLDENFSYERMVDLLNEKASEPEPKEIKPEDIICPCTDTEEFIGWGNERCIRCKECGSVC